MCLTATGKAVLRLTPAGSRSTLFAGAGLSLVGHGGDAYTADAYSGPRTFFGGVASVSGVVKLSHKVGLRLDAEDLVYVAHLGPCLRSGPGHGSVCDVYRENAGESTGSKLQNDLVLSLGFSMNLTELNRPPEHE
jgi:hypothetical protein